MGISDMADLVGLPADQFDEIMVELNAAHILPDKPVEPVEPVEPTKPKRKPAGTPVDAAKPAILAIHEFGAVEAAYYGLPQNKQQDFRVFALGTANAMFKNLSDRPSNNTYAQLMAWFEAQKGSA